MKFIVRTKRFGIRRPKTVIPGAADSDCFSNPLVPKPPMPSMATCSLLWLSFLHIKIKFSVLCELVFIEAVLLFWETN